MPPDLTFGTYRLLDLTDDAAGGLYEGKVILDKTYGHAAYGCMICCGPEIAIMGYYPLDVPTGGWDVQEVLASNSCGGGQQDVTGDFPTWWTDNTAIATATGSRINGIAPGTTNHHAPSVEMYWGYREYYQLCPKTQETTTAPTNVTCAVPTSYTQTSGYGDSSGVLHFQYTWDSNTGNLADLSACTVREYVTYPGSSPFNWPSPPYLETSTTFPVTLGGPGTTGTAGDTHSYPGFQQAYTANSFTATQYYQYVCPCSNGGQPVNLMGPLSIVRTVYFSTPNGLWTYQASKSGVNASTTLPNQ